MAREVHCHAVNLFFEARGEIPLGRRWVLDVVKNRVKSEKFPDTYCGVITMRNQFSWYNEEKKYLPDNPLMWELYLYNKYKDNKVELGVLRRSFEEAFIHYLYADQDSTNGCTYYMTEEAFAKRKYKPFPKTVAMSTVGNHIFFKECSRYKQCQYFSRKRNL